MLLFQDPHCGIENTIHGALLSGLSQSIRGGGAFAFASGDGIDLLLGSEEFSAFIHDGAYTLVVGFDEITNEKALEKLIYYRDKHQNLDVKAFVHGCVGRLFHPKFSWFIDERESGKVLVGSGNLTSRGLRSNWEVFSFLEVLPDIASATEGKWNSWLDNNQKYLLELEHEDVLKRAKRNQLYRTNYAEKEGSEVQEGDLDVLEGALPKGAEEVLIFEMPKGRKGKNAYSQVNFGKDLFEDFLGIDIDSPPEYFEFQHVEDDGALSALERRPPVIKLNSTNFNFELDAPKGLGLLDGQPFGVFVKIANGLFRYKYISPKNKNHYLFSDLVNEREVKKGNRNRRIILSSKEAVALFGELDFLNALLGMEY